MIILLLGLMGSGKSSTGRLLAKTLDLRFLEMDHLILEKTGFNSISEVYEHRMSLWKESELEVSKELSKEENLVIAASGGLSENQLNILYFQENSKHLEIIQLEVATEKAEDRLLNSSDHKFLDSEKEKIKQNLEKMASKRNFFNELYASLVIDTTDIDQEKTVELILKSLKGRV